MKNINDYNPTNYAGFLITEQAIGGNFRDEGDLRNAQFHALMSVNFTIDILKNIEGTIEDKIAFLEKAKEEIPKFKVK